MNMIYRGITESDADEVNDMKLYKNVSITDLKSIIEKGILSMDESRNNNWIDGKRVDNATNVVYLFDPITNNSFPHYGIALIEVETSRARPNEMKPYDGNIGLYNEYVADKIPESEITKIIIPTSFKSDVDISDSRIVYADVTADVFDRIESDGVDKYGRHINGRTIYRTINQIEFDELIGRSNSYLRRGFRGENANGEVIDFEKVNYHI